MKVATVTVTLLKVPLKRPYRTPYGERNAQWFVVAHLTTTEGVAGLGYVDITSPSLVAPVAAATRELGQLLVGAGVLQFHSADLPVCGGASLVAGDGLHPV